MRTIFFLLVSFAGSLFTLQAQNGKISGKIISENQSAVDYTRATVALLRSKDSGVIKLSVSNKTGDYLFENLKDGSYRVAVTVTGYQKVYSAPVELNAAQPTVSLPALSLTPAAKSMTDVTVTAKRPLIEQRIDRTIVNVDAR